MVIDFYFIIKKIEIINSLLANAQEESISNLENNIFLTDFSKDF
jgi:hypothetical protein